MNFTHLALRTALVAEDRSWKCLATRLNSSAQRTAVLDVSRDLTRFRRVKNHFIPPAEYVQSSRGRESNMASKRDRRKAVSKSGSPLDLL